MSATALSFVCDESAVTSIEYALLGSLIAVVIVGSMTTMGMKVIALYEIVSVAVAAAA